MGCSSSCCSNMLSKSEKDLTLYEVERKLYLAKESPEPIFDLSECALQSVPAGIFPLCKVYRKEAIILSNNLLYSLDGGGQLSDLYLITVLNISHNNFRVVTSDIKHLVNLNELYVQHNKIEHLPDEISYLKCLHTLNASNNRLTILNPLLGKLQRLHVLKINNNANLHNLCPELCFCKNLVELELDVDRFTNLPSDVVTNGIQCIMKYLCDTMNEQYLQPEADEELQSPSNTTVSMDSFRKKSIQSWETQQAEIAELENKFYNAAQKQRSRFLSEVIQDQCELDAEVEKIQKNKDEEKQKLVQLISAEGSETERLIDNLLSTKMNSDMIEQQKVYDKNQHDKLMKIVREKQDNLKRNDVLKDMETYLENNCLNQLKCKSNAENVEFLKQSMIFNSKVCNEKLDRLLQVKDNNRTALVRQLLEDQDIQKAIVASLIQQTDVKSWSLNQEISLISSHLERLTKVEQDKKKSHLSYNHNELLEQRTQLIFLLDDLFDQKNKRKQELLNTLKEIELESGLASDMWLRNYQNVAKSIPKTFINMTKKLDPDLINLLLQEGAIHCLPFVVQLFFSDSLADVTDEKLLSCGITISADRKHVLNAIEFYLKDRNFNVASQFNYEPSAPQMTDNIEQGKESPKNTTDNELHSECVICMNDVCEIVFVPCGHMCCCYTCSEKELIYCPMCRSDIERKIKVIVA